MGTTPGRGRDAHLGVRDTCAAPLPPPASPSTPWPSGRGAPRRPHLSRVGRGAVAVAVARGQRAGLPMFGDGREGHWLPGDGPNRWYEFAGWAGTGSGWAPGGLRWAAGLAAGSWLPGWGGRAARLRLH